MGNMSQTGQEKRTGESELRYLVQRALHKLCQPLSGIRFCVELSAMKNSVPDLKEALSDAEREVERAVMIVEIFRDLVEADEIPSIFEEFDVAEALRSAVADAQSLAAEREQNLELKVLSTRVIQNDGPRFSNVFGQILQSCCQESAPGSDLVVTLETSKAEAAIRIETPGEEIDLAPEAAAIFHEAIEAPNTPRIRLQVAARHIRSMGGGVSVKKTAKGREIEFRLPLTIQSRES